MYTTDHDRMVEDKCYKISHIEKVIAEIHRNFPKYFEDYLKSRESHISADRVDALRDLFIVDDKGKRLVFDRKTAFLDLHKIAIAEFEKDRENYIELFDKELLEEYKDDPSLFKSVALKVETAIIRRTIQNKFAKQLDKYRAAFNMSNPSKLLEVVTKLSHFSENYMGSTYNKNSYENIVNYKDLGFTVLDTEEYTAYGVIGGGIKSTMLYKNYPEAFSCRSRMGVWALWYLVAKNTFNCEMDSEFLMIDPKKNITQQNYFYPYELFSFYALQIYLMLKAEADKLGIVLDVAYRFVYVEAFLNFVAIKHIDQINTFSKIYEEKSYGWY